jgi:cation:H+ antiporter
MAWTSSVRDRVRCRAAALAAAAAAGATRVSASTGAPGPEAIRTTVGPLSALYTFPSIMASALVIGWAAEAAQFLIAQGLALAILAWLQTLPEYAVEFVIAWQSGKDPAKTHLMIANLTGSLRLLTGLGWPMIYFVWAIARRRMERKRRQSGGGPAGHEAHGRPARGGLRLEPEHSVEVIFLIPAVLYFLVILLKGNFAIYDSAVLLAIYVGYLIALRRIPPQSGDPEEMDAIPRRILALRRGLRNATIAALFLLGGGILLFMAHPFVESMLAVAVSMGVAPFIFVQWVAPFLSEFPEKVTAFNWARRVRFAPMAIMNFVSSNFNQWTVLAATLPIVYSISSGRVRAIHFDTFQSHEILLTISQSMVALVLLANLHIARYEAAGILALFLVQFIKPGLRLPVTLVNFAWAAVALTVMLRETRGRPPAWTHFRRLVLRRGPDAPAH